MADRPQALVALQAQIAGNPVELADYLRNNPLEGFHVDAQGNIVVEAAGGEQAGGGDGEGEQAGGDGGEAGGWFKRLRG